MKNILESKYNLEHFKVMKVHHQCYQCNGWFENNKATIPAKTGLCNPCEVLNNPILTSIEETEELP